MQKSNSRKHSKKNKKQSKNKLFNFKKESDQGLSKKTFFNKDDLEMKKNKKHKKAK